MRYFVKEVQYSEFDKRTAGSKARDDVDAILEQSGYQPIEATIPFVDRSKLSLLGIICYHQELKKQWIDVLEKLSAGDTLVLQFPIVNHTIFFKSVMKYLKKKGVIVYFIVHDLELLRWSKREDTTLRSKIRVNIEEKSVLTMANGIVTHNQSMLQYLEQWKIGNKGLVSLDIFDYLIPDFEARFQSKQIQKHFPVIIAGNLSPHKAGYVYHLPPTIPFNLYGVGYTGEPMNLVNYKGSYPPNDLPFAIEGSFGLVWDGESVETCQGVYGDYLRVNNPHKTSFYLASGLPVLIWSQAAIADFIVTSKCGIAVDRIEDIAEILSTISEEDYQVMKDNAYKMSQRLRQGYYTNRALDALDLRIKG